MASPLPRNFTLREAKFDTFVGLYCITVYCKALGDSGDFQTSRYQGIVKATVSYRPQDLRFKISEGSDQN